ncbi:hypothetical protein BJX61DRAFT_546809 [Aspergillus egyptiacus]|nr:hypothetical protein BJX61DRAFT_546809 [Aspergillus egyptiacus]
MPESLMYQIHRYIHCPVALKALLPDILTSDEPLNCLLFMLHYSVKMGQHESYTVAAPECFALAHEPLVAMAIKETLKCAVREFDHSEDLTVISDLLTSIQGITHRKHRTMILEEALEIAVVRGHLQLVRRILTDVDADRFPTTSYAGAVRLAAHLHQPDLLEFLLDRMSQYRRTERKELAALLGLLESHERVTAHLQMLRLVIIRSCFIPKDGDRHESDHDAVDTLLHATWHKLARHSGSQPDWEDLLTSGSAFSRAYSKFPATERLQLLSQNLPLLLTRIIEATLKREPTEKVGLFTGSESFLAHRVVLTYWSSYFAERSLCRSYRLDRVSAVNMKRVVEFMYIGRYEPPKEGSPSENIREMKELLEVATYLDIPRLREIVVLALAGITADSLRSVGRLQPDRLESYI